MTFDKIETRLKREMRVPPGFLLLLVLGLAYILPLLLAGVAYRDDMPRAMDGLTLWEKDGRPLASILSSLFSFAWPSFSGPALYDTSPIPQILGMVALAYGAARLGERLFPAGLGWVQALVVFPVIANPFMLQNLSYKFDAFTMALAVMLALIAATIEAGWATAVLVGLSLLLYQVAFNVFAGAACLLWLVDAARGEKADGNFLRQLAWGILALVAYGLCTKLLGGLGGGYAAQHSLLVSPSLEGLATMQFNFQFAAYYMTALLEDAPLLALGAALAMASFAVDYVTAGSGTSRERLARFILALLLVLLSVSGVLLVLQNPVMRPRTLMGFSMLLVFAAYGAYRALARWQGLRALCLGLATAWFFTLAAAYANATREQARFDATLVQSLIRDLRDAGFKPGGKLAFDGAEPYAPAASHALRKRIIGHILQPNMNGNSEWGFRLLDYYGLANTPIMDATEESLKALCVDGPATTAPWYQLFRHDDTVVVSFPKGVCFKG